MPATECLPVGAVRECDLDLDEHIARARLRSRHVLETQVARPIEAQRSHGVKTTFNAPPLR